MHEDLNLRKKDDERNKMIVEKGPALLSVRLEMLFVTYFGMIAELLHSNQC